MKYRPWNIEDRDKLAAMLDLDMGIEEIAKKLDRTVRSVEYEMSRTLETKELNKVVSPAVGNKEKREELQSAAVNFLDQKIPDVKYENIWDAIERFQSELKKVNTEQSEATISIETDKWIGIAFQGDLHLGNMVTNYAQLRKDKKLIEEADNVFLVINGDYCDNYISGSHAGGQLEALFPPATQKDLAKNYIESLKDKVLALVAGCHDLWSLKIDDFDLTEYLAKHGEAVYLGPGGTLYLTVGKVTYKLMMRHKYRYNSMDNPTATVKKMFEKCGGFDVGVVSHNHTASIEESKKSGLDGNLKRLFVRAGTYKVHDRFGKQQGYNEGMLSVPVILFNPKKRDIRGFQDLEEGIEYLDYLNREK